MLDHQFCALLVTDKWACFRIVHRIGKIANQNATKAPLCHLFDGKRAVQDTHVGMNTHDEKSVDSTQTKQPLNFGTFIGDHIACFNRDARMLTLPGFVGIFASVTATLFIINW